MKLRWCFERKGQNAKPTITKSTGKALIAAATKKSDFKMLDEIKWVNVTAKSFRKLDKDFQNYTMVLQNLAVKYSPISSKYLLDVQVSLNITS